MHEEFMAMLDKARELAGIPFVITSAYRCKAYDAKFGSNGNHSVGWAADIRADSLSRLPIIKALLSAGFERIGIGQSFIHCDAVPLKISALWLY
jgi:zinc D-Ala-D-Ala carboxypeptidase